VREHLTAPDTAGRHGSLRRRPRWRDEHGAVETMALLITFPLLFFFFLFAVQAAVAAHANQILKAAAQEGARVARLEGGTGEEGEDRARQVLDELNPEIFAVGPDPHVTKGADTARAVVTGTVIGIVPGLEVDLRQVSEGPVEKFRGADG
jgi:Flp pilus assembly protein TadG